MFDISDRFWQLGVSPFELVVRSVAVYAIFLVALRVSGKRELGQFTIFDLAAVLLAANALQPAITGPDASVPGALLIVATLFVVNHLVAWTRKRFAIVRRLLEPSPTTIAQDGAWIQPALNAEDLDDDDLAVALRQHGLEDVKDVKLAVLEHDGSISVVPRAGPTVRLRSRARRYRARAERS
ncbi:MAG: YetF domain-containing protein [Candidatus Limnocylindrales bacterium]